MADRRKLLVTGAAGGVGRACVRLLGATHDLLLTDVARPALEEFAQELRTEGYEIAAVHPGDIADDKVLAAIAAELGGEAPCSIIHAAGISPSLADWQTIMSVNLVASAKLLDAIEPVLVPGSVAILIASTAGYRVPVVPEIQALLDAPLASNLLETLGPLISRIVGDNAASMAGASYSFSKQALHRLCERRAIPWGARGGRIVTISPGLLLTPMGYSEIESTTGAAAMRGANPVPRTGTSMDVAQAARFLISDEASFITGCDLRVDGGAIAWTRHA